jgi:group I intron endonuclease
MIDHMAMDDEGIPEKPIVYQLPGESLKAACKRLGVSYNAAHKRRKLGLPDEQVFSPHDRRYHANNDNPYALPGEPLKATCTRLGLPYTRTLERLRSGLSYKEVFDQQDRKSIPVIVFGVEHTSLQEACRQHGIADSYMTSHGRIKKGISPDEAFTKALNPSRHKKGQVVVLGVKYRSFKEACRLIPSAPSITTIKKRFKEGMTIDEAFTTALHPTAGLRVCVFGVEYSSIREACKHLQPPADYGTISKWILDGMPPDEAFTRIPNPMGTTGVIYVLTHRASGKQYVGLTVTTLEKRWSDHISAAQSNSTAGQTPIRAAILVYGAEAFDIKIVDHGALGEDLQEKEQAWIDKLGTLHPNGYNVMKGGQVGGRHPRETKVDGKRFESQKDTARYVAKTHGITLSAALQRLKKGLLDVENPTNAKKPVVIDGIQFESKRQAAEYLAETRGISLRTAKYRVDTGKFDESQKKPTVFDGIQFESVKAAEAYVAQKYGISPDAASKRLYTGRVEVTWHKVPTMAYGIQFPDRAQAARYVAQKLGITFSVAMHRLCRGQIPTAAPTPADSLTPAQEIPPPQRVASLDTRPYVIPEQMALF